MIIYLNLPPDSEPTLQLFLRSNNAQSGTDISGTLVSGRTDKFAFDVDLIANGDYEYLVSESDGYPIGSGKIRIHNAGSEFLLCDEWHELDVPRYGDDQLWINPSESLEVNIERN